MNHKAFMCACTCFPHSIWIDSIGVKLITLQAWLFSVFNCVCACGGSVKSFHFGTQMQTTSLLPRLQAQYGSSLYTARLQSGLWWYMSRDNPGLQHNSPVVGLKLHRGIRGHLHVRPSYAHRPQLSVLCIWEPRAKPSAHLLSLEEGFILCSVVLSKSANLERTCNCMWVHVYVFTRESEQSQTGRKV